MFIAKSAASEKLGAEIRRSACRTDKLCGNVVGHISLQVTDADIRG
jgi:hypothetical protein